MVVLQILGRPYMLVLSVSANASVIAFRPRASKTLMFKTTPQTSSNQQGLEASFVTFKLSSALAVL